MSILNLPNKGTVDFTNPYILYSPNSYSSGYDTFQFSFIDSSDNVNLVTWELNIKACLQPNQSDLNYTTLCGDSINLVLPANYNIINTPLNGDLIISNNQISYLPNNGFEGTDSFQFNYTIAGSVPIVSSNTATCFIFVGQSINAVDDTVILDYNTPLTISPLVNDTAGVIITHINSVPLTLLTSTSIPNAILSLITNTTILITPSLTFIGTFNFSYTMQDVNGCVSTANVVAEVKSPSSVSLSGAWNGDFNYDLLPGILNSQGNPLATGTISLRIYVDSVLDSTSIWNLGTNMSTGVPISDIGNVYTNKYKAYIIGIMSNNSNWSFNKYNWAIATGNIGVNRGTEVTFQIQATVGIVPSNVASLTINKYRTIYTRYSKINSASPGVNNNSITGMYNQFNTPQLITHTEATSTMNYLSTNGTTKTIPVPVMNSVSTVVSSINHNSIQQEDVTFTSGGINLLSVSAGTSSVSRIVWNNADALVFLPNYKSSLGSFNNDGINNLTIDFVLEVGYETGNLNSPIHGSFFREAYWEIETSPGSSVYTRNSFTSSELDVYTDGLNDHRMTKTFLPTIPDGIYRTQMYYERFEGINDYVSTNNHEIIFYTY